MSKPEEGIVIPGNVPGSYQIVLGPAEMAASKATPEFNQKVYEEFPWWYQAHHFGVCSECMNILPRCTCDD